MTIDGILNLDKPRGKTSFEVVALIRRFSGERRVGHAGTLDPEATGVLPVCLGQATRLVEFLIEGSKSYQAEIELGITTDTYDATGKITSRADTSFLTARQVEAAVACFTGLIRQLPPVFSAVKHKGKPLYHWARAGIDVPRSPREVEFSRLEVLSWQPPLLTLEVECSKGAYIRSLAYDLGLKLGCGAHLRNLVRLRSGPFHIGDTVTVATVEDAFKRGCWSEVVHPVDAAVLHLPAVTVDEDEERAVVVGRPLLLTQEGHPSGGRCRAYSHDGQFIALLHYDEKRAQWQPEKVFSRKP